MLRQTISAVDPPISLASGLARNAVRIPSERCPEWIGTGVRIGSEYSRSHVPDQLHGRIGSLESELADVKIQLAERIDELTAPWTANRELFTNLNARFRQQAH